MALTSIAPANGFSLPLEQLTLEAVEVVLGRGGCGAGGNTASTAAAMASRRRSEVNSSRALRELKPRLMMEKKAWQAGTHQSAGNGGHPGGRRGNSPPRLGFGSPPG